MKYFAVLLLASLCVAVYSEQLEVEPRGFKNSVVNAGKKLKGTVNQALAAAKGKLQGFVAAIGEQKGPVVAKLNDIKAKLQAEAKLVLAQAVSEAQKSAAKIVIQEINKLISELNNVKEQVQKLE